METIQIFDPGCQPEVGIATSGSVGHVTVALNHGGTILRLTADQAEELAADLLTFINKLRKPSDEELIRDAMAEAQEHPGRIVTR